MLLTLTIIEKITLVGIIVLSIILLIYLKIKNVSLECSKCKNLIPAYLNGRCQNCGYNNSDCKH